ncbi:MAG: hypothetical protein GX221_09715 [Candidatus Riflebacteria bacterium]|nr:hypothetical protein [Candidatus Riflebacteria bacterium]
MKKLNELKRKTIFPWILLFAAIIFTAGCSSSNDCTSGDCLSPFGPNITDGSQGSSGSGSPITGDTTAPGAVTSPIVTMPDDGAYPPGHGNAPLLSNFHPGWQQNDCLSCHDASGFNPDHNYSDEKLCYLCHGENGLPGFADKEPPKIRNLTPNPSATSVTITWMTDEPAVTQLTLRTMEGLKMDFPASNVYQTSHRIDIPGLHPGTTYGYSIVARDQAGNTSSTDDIGMGILSFTTEFPLPTSIPTTPTNPDTPPEEAPVSDPFYKKIEVVPQGNNNLHIFLETQEAFAFGTLTFYEKDKKTVVIVRDIEDSDGKTISEYVMRIPQLKKGERYYMEASVKPVSVGTKAIFKTSSKKYFINT